MVMVEVNSLLVDNRGGVMVTTSDGVGLTAYLPPGVRLEE